MFSVTYMSSFVIDNYDYVVPGARLVPTQQSKDGNELLFWAVFYVFVMRVHFVLFFFY